MLGRQSQEKTQVCNENSCCSHPSHTLMMMLLRARLWDYKRLTSSRSPLYLGFQQKRPVFPCSVLLIVKHWHISQKEEQYHRLQNVQDSSPLKSALMRLNFNFSWSTQFWRVSHCQGKLRFSLCSSWYTWGLQQKVSQRRKGVWD